MSLLALIVLPAVSLLGGVLWDGSGERVGPSGRAGLAVVCVALSRLCVAGLALLMSVSTNAPLGAVGGAVLVSILSQILDSITALGGLREYLPSHYAFAWSDLLSSSVDWSDIARGVLSALVYCVIFLGLAARRFATKDITS